MNISGAGIKTKIANHTFTAYLTNGRTLEHAQQIAGHSSPRTTNQDLRPQSR